MIPSIDRHHHAAVPLLRPDVRRTRRQKEVVELLVSRFNSSPGPFKAEVLVRQSGRAAFRVWPEAFLGKQGATVPPVHRDRIAQFAAHVAQTAVTRLVDRNPRAGEDNSFLFELE